ncbi:hypothetical protein ACFY9Y_35085 [Streptomyces fimicarius]|uniref:hypothetical protein n=1 Tax=Streptomyces griseus TaxID=1911 RepID=UPI0036F09983
MANTRRIDREIRNAKDKLDRIHREDSTALPVRDQAKLAGLTGYALAKATRLKPARGAERAAERIWQNAAETVAADVRVLEAERQQLINEEAAARRAKKSSGWW